MRAAAQFIGKRDDVDGTRVGIMGHSSGARDAILACANWDGYAALVCSSTAGIIPREEQGAAEGFYRRTLGSRKPGRPGEPSDLRVYPRDGALPWIDDLISASSLPGMEFLEGLSSAGSMERYAADVGDGAGGYRDPRCSRAPGALHSL